MYNVVNYFFFFIDFSSKAAGYKVDILPYWKTIVPIFSKQNHNTRKKEIIKKPQSTNYILNDSYIMIGAKTVKISPKHLLSIPKGSSPPKISHLPFLFYVSLVWM